jgi:hypothetical protein
VAPHALAHGPALTTFATATMDRELGAMLAEQAYVYLGP